MSYKIGAYKDDLRLYSEVRELNNYSNSIIFIPINKAYYCFNSMHFINLRYTSSNPSSYNMLSIKFTFYSLFLLSDKFSISILSWMNEIK